MTLYNKNSTSIKHYGSNTVRDVQFMNDTESFEPRGSNANVTKTNHTALKTLTTVTPEPMSKATKQNAQYLARVSKSIEAEKNFYDKKTYIEEYKNQTEKSEKSEKFVNNATLIKSQQYSSWWIDNKGHRAREIMNNLYDGVVNDDPCFINVYDRETRSIYKYNLACIIPWMFYGNIPERRGNKNGQTRFWKDLYINTDIYQFLSEYWGYLCGGSSEC